MVLVVAVNGWGLWWSKNPKILVNLKRQPNLHNAFSLFLVAFPFHRLPPSSNSLSSSSSSSSSLPSIFLLPHLQIHSLLRLLLIYKQGFWRTLQFRLHSASFSHRYCLFAVWFFQFDGFCWWVLCWISRMWLGFCNCGWWFEIGQEFVCLTVMLFGS